jgi:CysZ protein
MLTDLSKAIAQLRDPRLFKPLLLSLVLAVLLLGVLIAGAVWALTSYGAAGGGFFGFSFLDRAINWLVDSFAFALAVVIGLMLFPAAAIGLQSLFLDTVADGVEREYYPHLSPGRKQRISEIVATALRLTAVVLGLNLLLLIVWLVLLLVATPFAPIPFYLVNGYLLGREYFELVALRRMPPLEATVLRKQKLGWNMADGIVLTLLFSIPIVNFAGPIIAAAYITHRFHRVWVPDTALSTANV